MSIPLRIYAHIDGDAESIRSVADWLSGAGEALDRGVDHLTQLRSAVQDRWEGPAADAFGRRIEGDLRAGTNAAAEALTEASRQVTDLADLLVAAQNQIDSALMDAADAGVEVRDDWAWLPVHAADAGYGGGGLSHEDYEVALEGYLNLCDVVQEQGEAWVDTTLSLDDVMAAMETAGQSLLQGALVEVGDNLKPLADEVLANFSRSIQSAVDRGVLLAGLDTSDAALFTRLGQMDLDLLRGRPMIETDATVPDWFKHGGLVVELIFTAQGIRSDHEAGESMTQAVISQGLASVTGAAVGAAAAGTAASAWTGPGAPFVGAAAGIVAGTTAALGVNWTVDEMWEDEFGPPPPPRPETDQPYNDYSQY